MAICVSCNKNVSDIVKFKCPKCNLMVIRCAKCRSLSIPYKCQNIKCDFDGP